MALNHNESSGAHIQGDNDILALSHSLGRSGEGVCLEHPIPLVVPSHP